MTGSRAPKWLGTVSVVALLWYLMGVFAYIQQVTMSEEAIAALPEAQRNLLSVTPAWATGAFALAVNVGALACIALLLKKSWAVPLFMISLTAVVVQMFHAFFLANSFAVFGPGEMIMPIMVMAIAIYMAYLSRQAKDRGWLG